MKLKLWLLLYGSTPLACVSTAAPMHESVATDGGPDAQGQEKLDVPSAPREFQICDGTTRLRLHVLIEATGAREVRGSSVRVENGLPLLMVDGKCNYWIGGGWNEDPLSRDRPLQSGKLSAADTAVLEQALPLDDLTPLRDCNPTGAFHAGIRAIRVEHSSARCGSSGARFDSAWAALATTARSLLSRSVPLDGPIHVTAVATDKGFVGSVEPYTWPLPTLESFLAPDAGDPSGENMIDASRLVTAADDIKKLRTLRERYLMDRESKPGLYGNWDGLKVVEKDVNAFVYMRDALPYEDAQGLLQF